MFKNTLTEMYDQSKQRSVVICAGWVYIYKYIHTLITRCPKISFMLSRVLKKFLTYLSALACNLYHTQHIVHTFRVNMVMAINLTDVPI